MKNANIRPWRLHRTERATEISWAKFVAMLAVLLFVPCFFYLQASPAMSLHVETLFPAGTILISAIRLTAVSTASGKPKITVMTFYVFIYVFLGVAAVLQVASGKFAWPIKFNETTGALACLLVWLGIFSFELGYRNRPSMIARAATSYLSRRIVPNKVRIASAIAIFLSPALLAVFGGMGQILQSRSDKFTQAKDSIAEQGQVLQQLLNATERVPLFVCFAALLVWIKLKRVRLGDAPFSYFLITLLFVETAVISNPVSSERYWAGTVFLSGAYLFFDGNRRASLVPWGLGLALGFIVIFPFADLFRVSLDPDLAGTFSTPLISQLTEKGDFDSFQQVGNSLAYVNAFGYRLGQQFLGAIFFWFPRAYWPDKTAGSGALVADALGYDFNNLSMPLWGELFLDGGVLAVVVGFYYYGSIMAALDRSFQRIGALTVGSIIVPIYAIYQFTTLRGALLIASSLFTPVILMFYLISRKGNPAGGYLDVGNCGVESQISAKIDETKR